MRGGVQIKEGGIGQCLPPTLGADQDGSGTPQRVPRLRVLAPKRVEAHPATKRRESRGMTVRLLVVRARNQRRDLANGQPSTGSQPQAIRGREGCLTLLTLRALCLLRRAPGPI